MTTEDLYERLRGIQRCWDQALADLQEVSGGLEAIVKTPRENDLVAIAKHYGRDPKVFAIGMFDADSYHSRWKSIWRHMNFWHDLALGVKGYSGATSPTLPGVGRTRRMQ